MAFDPSKPFEIERPSFDPSQPFEVESQVAFDPSQPFEVEGKVAFDPSQPFTVEKTDDPTLGETAAGLTAEIAIASGLKYAGAVAGAAGGLGIGSVPAATIGYIGGALTGGVTGSIAAQKLEGRDEISWGRVLADTALNLIPVPFGKIKKGTTFTKEVIKNSAKQAGFGAGLGVTGAQIEAAVDDNRFLNPSEALISAGVGATLGLGLGALDTALNKSSRKLFGKSPEQIDKMYKDGDPDAITLVDGLTGGDPTTVVSRKMNSILRHVAPTKLIGNKASEAVRNAQDELNASKDTATKILEDVNKVTRKMSDEDKAQVNSYLDGKATELPASAAPLVDTIEQSRDEIARLSNKLVELSDNGFLDLAPDLVERIRNSADQRTYQRRTYRFYDDPNYSPSVEADAALRKSLKDKNKSDLEVKAFMNDMLESRDKPELRAKLGMNRIAEHSNLYKKRNALSKEMRDYLGIYTEPGERIFGTISSLGREVADQELGMRVTRNLLDSNMAVKRSQLREVLGDRFSEIAPQYRALNVRGLKQSIDNDDIVVLPEVQQAFDQLYITDAPRKSTNAAVDQIDKLVSTATGLTKFAKVPLAPAAYSPQVFSNISTIIGMGMNPLRGIDKAFKTMGQQVANKGLSVSEYNRYKRLGLVDKEIITGDIREAFKKGYDLPVGRTAKKISAKVGKVYSAFDTAMRISVFEGYSKLLRDVVPDLDNAVMKSARSQILTENQKAGRKMGDKAIDKLAKQRAGETIDRISGELTNSTYYNYGRVPPAVKRLSRYGFFNEFISFIMEEMRTKFNQANLAKSFVDGSFARKLSDDLGVPVDASALRRNGMARIAALSAYGTAASGGLYVFNKQKGKTDEEMKAERETIMPDFLRNANVTFERDGEDFSYTDMSYRMPFSELTSIPMAALRGEGYDQAASNVLQSIFDKFFGGGTMVAKRFIDASRNYDPQRGKPISEDVQTIDRLYDQVKYFGGEFTPGFWKEFQNKADRTLNEQAARLFLAERKSTTDAGKAMYFKMLPIKRNLGSIRSKYSGSLRSGADPASAYRDANDLYRQNMGEMVKHANNLRVLGYGNDDIEKYIESASKQYTLSKIEKLAIMGGVVPDMKVAIGVSGTTPERAKAYADLYEVLPEDLSQKMVQQEVVSKQMRPRTYNLMNQILQFKGVQ